LGLDTPKLDLLKQLLIGNYLGLGSSAGLLFFSFGELGWSDRLLELSFVDGIDGMQMLMLFDNRRFSLLMTGPLLISEFECQKLIFFSEKLAFVVLGKSSEPASNGFGGNVVLSFISFKASVFIAW
jgi:hypothetical protein